MASLSSLRLNHSKISMVVQMLLDAGANVNSPPSEKHSSALHAAVKARHYGVAAQFLARGADVNAHDPRFGTALSAAARRGKVELMKHLIEKGADLSLSGEVLG